MLKPQSLVVIDNFYENPLEIREHALSLEYSRKERATYPGMEAFSDRDWTVVREELASYINEDVSAPCPKPERFKQGKFRIAIADDNITRLDNVHVDQQKYSGIVYLTPDSLCKGGIALFKHKQTSALTLNRDVIQCDNFPKSTEKGFHAQILSYFKNDENWEKIGEIPMRFNRAVILMAQVFHGSTGIFGDHRENGRLTQHFEFYTHNAM